MSYMQRGTVDAATELLSATCLRQTRGKATLAAVQSVICVNAYAATRHDPSEDRREMQKVGCRPRTKEGLGYSQ